MKKILSFILVFTLILPLSFGFSSCKKTTSEETESKTITRTETLGNELGKLIKPIFDIDQLLNVWGSKTVRIGVLDEKTNSNFYNIIFNGHDYADGDSVQSGNYNWNDIEKEGVYQYFERGGEKSTFYPNGDPYSMLKNQVDFTSIIENEEIDVSIDFVKQIHRKLNLAYYMVNSRSFNSNWRMTSIVTDIYNLDYAKLPEGRAFESMTKLDGIYEFLTKPMEIMSTSVIIAYDFTYVTSKGVVTDEVVRVYVDADYGICLGADQLVKRMVGGQELTLYNPLFRVFLKVFDR